MEYKIEYRYSIDNVGNIVNNLLVSKPKKIEWNFNGEHYVLESKLEFGTVSRKDGSTKVVVTNSVFDLMYSAYLSDHFILILYSDNKDYNNIFPAPYNLVLYNLKKQMLKTIASPQSINVEGSLPYIGVSGEKLMIDGVEHMKIALGYDSGPERIREFRYLNLETFEFHPTENIFWDWIDER